MTDFKRSFKDHSSDSFEKWDQATYMTKYNQKQNGFDEKTVG